MDVTQSTGTGHLQKGHGVAFADLDNDGDEDVFASLGGAFLGDKYRDVLFENPGHPGRWLSVRLVGTNSNRAAIGARLRLVLHEGGRETQRTRWVTSGGSFGANPLTQHVGIGMASLERVQVYWPGARSPQIVDRREPQHLDRDRRGPAARAAPHPARAVPARGRRRSRSQITSSRWSALG